MAVQTMLFVGVSTQESSVRKLFPRWMSALNLDAELLCVDLPIDVIPDEYRRVVTQLAYDARQVGALITTHKVGVFQGCFDLFAEFSNAADVLEEVGVISKTPTGLLAGDANDFIATRRVCERLLRSPIWQAGSREVLIIGAGGAGTALAYTLASGSELGCSRLTVCDTNNQRIEDLENKLRRWQMPLPTYAFLSSGLADEILSALGPGALVVNASGMGKDRPGAPVSAEAVFPARSIVWEFNYRFRDQSTPNFLQLATAQQSIRELCIEDGWDYFMWGWAVAITKVFRLPAVDVTYGKMLAVTPDR